MSRVATPRDLIPEAHCVLGTMLRPFSLGHHLLFLRTDLPFVGNPYVFTSADQLALGVFICGTHYTQTLQAILRGEWANEFSRWHKKLKPWPWQRTRFIHEKEAARFADYLADGYRRAPVWRHESETAVKFSAPWECLLQARLVAGGFSHTEVLEMYQPAAWYHYQTLAEISQADTCTSLAKWRKIFYTEDDDRRLHPTGSAGILPASGDLAEHNLPIAPNQR
jgi:hypothetical protein